MTDDFTMLNYIRQNTEMGIDGIKCVLREDLNTQFKTALTDQLDEYTRIYNSANTLLLSKGGVPKDVNAAAKIGSQISGIVKSVSKEPERKIAESMIKGSTAGVTQITKHIHDYTGDDEGVMNLANCLKDAEENNIDEMKKYL